MIKKPEFMEANLSHKVLIVDDEESILEMVKYNLETKGYDVKTALDGEMALRVANRFRPDLILLDVMMPGMDGIETCALLRKNATLQETHVVFLTARAEESSEIAAFEVGANEYITKPIKPRVLMSRIDALFRRGARKKKSSMKIEAGDLLIDRMRYMVCIGNKEITLPKKEFELLAFLAQSPNKVFSRDDLLHNIWGTDVYVLSRTVDVHIRKIREKVGDHYITTVKGVGYKFQLT